MAFYIPDNFPDCSQETGVFTGLKCFVIFVGIMASQHIEDPRDISHIGKNHSLYLPRLSLISREESGFREDRLEVLLMRRCRPEFLFVVRSFHILPTKVAYTDRSNYPCNAMM